MLIEERPGKRGKGRIAVTMHCFRNKMKMIKMVPFTEGSRPKG
jgi:hypothetical protein